jgi:hypothetical protein
MERPSGPSDDPDQPRKFRRPSPRYGRYSLPWIGEYSSSAKMVDDRSSVVSRDPVRTDRWRVDLIVHRGHGGGVGECVLPNAGDLARYRDLLDVVVGGEWYALPPPGTYYLDVMAYGPWIITLELVDPGVPAGAIAERGR